MREFQIVVTPRTGPLAAFIQKTAPEVKLELTANYEESLMRLMSGSADVAALNFQVGAALVRQLYPGKVTIPRAMFAEQPVAVAVRKGQFGDLLTRLDRGLSRMKADGAWQRITDSWMQR